MYDACFKCWYCWKCLSQPAKLYKLKHLSKVEVITNDPSGCTFTLVMPYLIFIYGNIFSFLFFPPSGSYEFFFLPDRNSYRDLITSEARVLLHPSGPCETLMIGNFCFSFTWETSNSYIFSLNFFSCFAGTAFCFAFLIYVKMFLAAFPKLLV